MKTFLKKLHQLICFHDFDKCYGFKLNEDLKKSDEYIRCCKCGKEKGIPERCVEK